jgi:hypothetical protein
MRSEGSIVSQIRLERILTANSKSAKPAERSSLLQIGNLENEECITDLSTGYPQGTAKYAPESIFLHNKELKEYKPVDIS